MTYIKQTFSLNEKLGAKKLRQMEDNVKQHVHGLNGVASNLNRSWMVRLTSDQNVTSTAYTKIAFDSENFDNGGIHSAGTVTVDVAGYYIVTCSVKFYNLAAAVPIQVDIYVNGSLEFRSRRGTIVANAGISVTISAVLNLSINDTIEIYCQSTDADYYIDADYYSWFGGFLAVPTGGAANAYAGQTFDYKENVPDDVKINQLADNADRHQHGIDGVNSFLAEYFVTSLSTSQTLTTAGTYYTINWDLNETENANLSSGVYTAPYSGLYMFNVMVGFDDTAANDYCIVGMQINSVEYAETQLHRGVGHEYSMEGPSHCWNVLAELTAGDTVELYASDLNTASAKVYQDGSSFRKSEFVGALIHL